MTLDVLISTLGRAGIERVAAMTLPEVAGVTYIVSWQMPEGDLPSPLVRDDVKVYTLDSRGLSLNRNNAIARSTADAFLIADDDLDYSSEGLKAVINAFERHPEVDIATFRYSGPKIKNYPDRETDLHEKLPAGYYVSSVEMAVRRCPATESLRFDPRFGLGAPDFCAGEEELFHWTARRRGVRCRFFPVEITSHPGVTTGERLLTDRRLLQSFGAVIAITTPLTALPRLVLKAWRVSRAGGSFTRSLYYIVKGALIAPRLRI